MPERTPRRFPACETLRIVDSRWVASMHDHLAESLLSGDELLEEIDAEEAEKA